MKKEHNIDLDKPKGYGPRVADGIVVPGSQKVEDGSDALLQDGNILRFCVSRGFDVDKVVSELLSHLEWR